MTDEGLQNAFVMGNRATAMALQDLRVRVQTKTGQQLGEMMNDIRGWLAREQIRVAGFKFAPIGQGFIVDVRFTEADHADRFRTQFEHQPML